VRNWILRIHLWLGLTAALFLIVLGLSGAIIAFEGDYDHWFNPGLWYVTPQAQRLSQQSLLEMVQQRFAPARVEAIQMQDGRVNLAQDYFLTPTLEVFVNPYNGAILGTRDQDPFLFKVIGTIHQLHIRLVHIRIRNTDVGKWLVEIAGLEMLILIPTGLILWWRKKQWTINWKASWKRINWDLHSIIGIYAGTFLFLATVTGFFISFEQPIYWITHSGRLERTQQPKSTPPGSPSPRPDLDAIAQASDEALPNATTVAVVLPGRPNSPYVFEKRVPQDASLTMHSAVYIDQYTGKVLRVEDFNKISAGYRAVRINRSMHTGDYWGLPGHIILSLSSFLLSITAITGIVIWWKKLASS